MLETTYALLRANDWIKSSPVDLKPVVLLKPICEIWWRVLHHSHAGGIIRGKKRDTSNSFCALFPNVKKLAIIWTPKRDTLFSMSLKSRHDKSTTWRISSSTTMTIQVKSSDCVNLNMGGNVAHTSHYLSSFSVDFKRVRFRWGQGVSNIRASGQGLPVETALLALSAAHHCTRRVFEASRLCTPLVI